MVGIGWHVAGSRRKIHALSVMRASFVVVGVGFAGLRQRSLAPPFEYFEIASRGRLLEHCLCVTEWET